MRDRSKKLLVINTGKKESEQAGMTAQPGVTHIIGGGGMSVNMSDYLLKSIWDKVWEIRTDSAGTDYIFGKLPVLLQYGLTMYSGEGADIPTLASGLPFDGRTIWYNPETQQIEVIGGTGGGSGEGVSNFWDLSGIPSWITNTKPIYDYSEIKGNPDLSVYALASDLAKYVTLAGDETITGLKSFAKGLQIGGLPITKSQDDVIYLDANLVVRGGITMYAEGAVNIPSIIDSLPIASTTAKGIASFDGTYFAVDSNGKVTLLAANVGLNEEELAAYLTENKYATQSWVYSLGYASSSDLNALQTKVNDFLEGSDTDTIINKWKELEVFLSGLSESDNLATILGTKWTQDNTKIANWDTAYSWGNHANVGYALKSYVDSTFVTLGSTQTITGEKNFTGGLKVNGSPIYYDTEKKYWKLEGDLLVTGGVTMYGSDSSFTPSTIMDAIAVDGTTISKSGGVLKVIGGTGGGVADSVAWANITGKPTWIGSSKPTYSYSEITGAISTTELQNYLTSNSYLNVIGGDDRYLKLGGGTLSGDIVFQDGYLRFTNSSGSFLGAYNVNASGEALYLKGSTWNTILHSGNYSQYALPLSGGTLDGVLTLRAPSSSYDSWIEFSNKSNSVVHKLGVRRPESSFGLQYYNGSEYYNIWHAGNDGSGSGLDADLLDGQEETTFAKWKSGIASSGEHRHIGYAYGSNGWITSGAAMSFGADKNYFMQIQGGGSKNKDVLLYARYIYEGIYSDWKTIAFTDSNVASATKLQTARTIWGQSFDGSSGIDGDFTMANTKSIQGKDSSNVARTLLTFSSNNDLFIGRGSSVAGYATKLCGYSIQLCTNSDQTERVRISSSGNVGIGTTSPSSLLHVNGDGRIANIHFRGAFINLNRDGATSAIYDSTKTALEIEAASGVSILRTYNVTRQASIALHTNGNIGIGTISPSEKLHVEGGVRVNGQIIGATSIASNTTNGFFVGNRNDGLGVTDGGLLLYTYGKTPISFYASGERMRIDASSGNVGIGTPNPQDKLDVAGNIITSGGILFTRVGTGTYNKFTINSNTTYGVEIEAPRATDSSTGTALPIFIGWRGGALGIKITSGGNLLANGGITMYSDQRKKTILNHVELSLKDIANAPLIEHYYNSDEKKTTHVGSIAQYWANMNDWFCKLDSEGFYTMEIQNAALASAISIARELDRYETKTDKAIKKLKKRICELEEEVERLKSA